MLKKLYLLFLLFSFNSYAMERHEYNRCKDIASALYDAYVTLKIELRERYTNTLRFYRNWKSSRYMLAKGIDKADVSVVLKALENNVDVNKTVCMPKAIRDQYYVLPLEMAIRKNNPEIVKILLDHKANPNYRPLIFWRYESCCTRDDKSESMIKIAYSNCTDRGYNGYCINSEAQETVKLLIDQGVNFDERDFLYKKCFRAVYLSHLTNLNCSLCKIILEYINGSYVFLSMYPGCRFVF